MNAQSLDVALALAAVLFVIGLAGIIARRSLVFMLLCTEIMLNAARLRLHRRGRPLGPARRPGDVHLPPGHGRRGSRGGTGPDPQPSRASSRISTPTRYAREEA